MDRDREVEDQQSHEDAERSVLLELPDLDRDAGGARNDLIPCAKRVADLLRGEARRREHVPQTAHQSLLIERKRFGHKARY